MQIAEIGNYVTWKQDVRGHGEVKLTGGVLNVLSNSVTVDLTVMGDWAELGLETRTSVKHGKYTVIEKKGTSYMNKDLQTYKVVPGSIENYHMLRDLGKKDGEIQELWKKYDKEVNWHNARFYDWKKGNGLVGQKGRPKNETPVESTLEEVAQDVVETLKADEPIEEPTTQAVEYAQSTVEGSKKLDEKVLEEIRNAPIEIAPIYSPDAQANREKAYLLEIETLRNQLAATRSELWSERTARLFTLQRELDAIICESNGIQIADYDTEHILATIVELAEVAQEEQSFKYWKKNKSVDRTKLLEELADVLHFILSRGVQRGVKSVVLPTEVLHDDCGPRKTVADQMLLVITLLLDFRKEWPNEDKLYNSLFEAFYKLVGMLGFEWDELVSAYEVKNLKNRTRQNENY